MAHSEPHHRRPGQPPARTGGAVAGGGASSMAILGSVLMVGASLGVTFLGMLAPMVLDTCGSEYAEPQCEYADVWFPALLLGPGALSVAGLLAVWVRCRGRPRTTLFLPWAGALAALVVVVNELSRGQLF